MDVEALGISGAWLCTPRTHGDDRGLFLEWFRGDVLATATGRRFDVVQANHSVSRRGVVRGIHFADVPPSQAKYITVLSGSLIDYVVDVRVGSPTFGQWDSVLLDTVDRRAVYLPEGMGHAFAALEDQTTAMYLVTAPHSPSRERGIHPLDPAIGLALPEGMVNPLLSPKDAVAPSLAEALDQGLLPSYAACQEYYASLR
jgi:dTDP-4-dehydrorhamnose 3,5-epimerase